MTKNPYYQGPASDHFDGTRFHGPAPPADKSRADLFRLMFRTQRAEWPKWVENPASAPVVERVHGAALRVTSIGHATHLIQTRGVNILVDPVWSERASPYTFAGPKRVRAPGLELSDLPPIHAVLITHNHYDHLDLAAVCAIKDRFGCRIIVPLGNDAIIRRHRPNTRIKARIEPYDWGDRVLLGQDVAATLVPCHHWSARGLRDRRMALWTAYVIETPDGAIYYLGDTAYRDGALFRDISRRFGPPRLAIIPIGAYEPRWFMRDHHVDPAEAVAIFRDCKASYALAHHWGTFRLTAEPIDEPPRRLAESMQAAGIPADRFRVQSPGEAFDVPERAHKLAA